MAKVRQKKPAEIVIRGVGLCPGIAVGKVVFPASRKTSVRDEKLDEQSIEEEIGRLKKALGKSKRELVQMRRDLQSDLDHEGLQLLDAHLCLIQDPDWTKKIEERIREMRKNSEVCVIAALEEYRSRFERIKDPTLKERFADVQDISNRLLRHLGKQAKGIKRFDEAVLFAHEIAPSDTFWAKKAGVIAFVSQKGGPTCHSAIMAKSQGIPYVVGVDFDELNLAQKLDVVVDGEAGVVVINPSKEQMASYRLRQEELKLIDGQKRSRYGLVPTTADGQRIVVSANAERGDVVNEVVADDGIGLFRSESIALRSGLLPTEEEQFLIFRDVVKQMKGKPVTIRVFDLGADKTISTKSREDNPFLGCRAIRFLLKEKHIFKAQARAILSASAWGPVKIMFPMIAKESELIMAKELLEEAKEELADRGIAFSANVAIGCMIEVPSAALAVDRLIPHVDFLSIGTNDLIQYTLAVDRGNANLSYLFDPHHPAVLRLIHHVVSMGAKHNIPVSVCGEMASDKRYIPTLLGLGVRELSVNLRAIPYVKDVVSRINLQEVEELARGLL